MGDIYDRMKRIYDWIPAHRSEAGGIFSGFLLFVFTVGFVFFFRRELSTIVPLGTVCLGAVIGWVMRFYINRTTSFGIAEFSAVIAALVGATIAGLFKTPSGVMENYFFYPVGLFIGFFGAQVWNLFVPEKSRPS